MTLLKFLRRWYIKLHGFLKNFRFPSPAYDGVFSVQPSDKLPSFECGMKWTFADHITGEVPEKSNKFPYLFV